MPKYISEADRARIRAEYEQERMERGVSWRECFCGCGKDAGTVEKTSLRQRRISGEPNRFIAGHRNEEWCRATQFVGFGDDPYEVVDCGHSTPCWLYIGRKDQYGYGRTSRDGYRLAHRWMYEREVGLIPQGLQLDHLCRVTGCINPSHLEPVTPTENQRRGVKPVITLEIARAMRDEIRAGKRQKDVAAQFGVKPSLVSSVNRQQVWRE